MSMFIRSAVAAAAWGNLSHVPYGGGDYKDGAADSSARLQVLWEREVGPQWHHGVPDGLNCPRAYLAECAPAWETVRRRYLRRLAAMPLSDLRAEALWAAHDCRERAERASSYWEDVDD